MRRYRVVFMARQVGAIGVFYRVAIDVESVSPETAKHVAWDKMTERYEINHVVSVSEITE